MEPHIQVKNLFKIAPSLGLQPSLISNFLSLRSPRAARLESKQESDSHPKSGPLPLRNCLTTAYCLMICSIAAGCLNIRGTSDQQSNNRLMNKKRQTDRKDNANSLLLQINGRSINVESSVRMLTDPHDSSIKLELIHFQCPESKKPWIGSKQDCYISTSKGIIGMRLHENVIISFSPSLLQQAPEGTAEDLKRFATDKVDYNSLFIHAVQGMGTKSEANHRIIDLRDIFGADFFGPSSSSFSKKNPVHTLSKASIQAGVLKIELTKKDKTQCDGEIYIALNELRVVGATVCGKSVFPK